MTHDAAVWLANHITGPNAEKNPFGCFWCGRTVMKHKEACPAYDAIHALDDETTTPDDGTQ